MSFYRNSLAGVVVAAALFAAAPAAAQGSPFSLEARTGVTLPQGDLEDTGADSGILFGLDGFWTVDPALSIYAGWGYHQFSADRSASGPRLGLKALFQTPGDATPWIRAGATFNAADSPEGTADRAAGLEGGAGIDFALSPRVSITPAARFHTFPADFGVVEMQYSYLSLDLGLHVHF